MSQTAGLARARSADWISDDFERFVRERAPGAQALASRILGEVSGAMALLPAAFAEAWAEPDPDAALGRLVARSALDALTERCASGEYAWEDLQPRFEAGAHAQPVSPWSASQLERVRKRGAMRALIERLPDPHRSVLLLRDVTGWSGSEAAAVLGTELAAVDATLHQGRLALRALVDAALHPERGHRDQGQWTARQNRFDHE
jgi:RNA polymerase sigma-70 factor (ECF subfamily)